MTSVPYEKKNSGNEALYGSIKLGSKQESFASGEDSTLNSEFRDTEYGDGNRFAMAGLDGPNGNSVIDSRLAQEIDDFEALNRDPIFVRCCNREQYDEKPTCKVCGKAFSKLKLVAKKHCKFCGGSICEEHGRKRRPNPENTSEYLRICDVCDEKYINRTILKEFNDKLKSKEGEIQDLERKIREAQLKIFNEQKEYDELCLKKSRNDKNYSDQMKFLSDDIARTKEEVKRCEKDNVELQKEYNKSQDRINELDNEIQGAEQEYEKLVTDASKLTNQIEALNQDIAQMNREIRNIEDYVSQNKSYANNTPQNEVKTASRPVEEPPSYRESVLSSATESKLNSYKKGTMKQNKSQSGESKPSGSCDVKCNVF